MDCRAYLGFVHTGRGTQVSQVCQRSTRTHSEQERERNVLFNDALNTFYLRLYGVIWLRTILIVRKETRCRHIGYSYRLTARVLLYAPSHRQDNHTTAFVTPVVDYWLEREIAQWVHPMKDRSDDPPHHE